MLVLHARTLCSGLDLSAVCHPPYPKAQSLGAFKRLVSWPAAAAHAERQSSLWAGFDARARAAANTRARLVVSRVLDVVRVPDEYSK